MISNKMHPAFERLPKRLAISFPIWGLYDTPGKNAAYRDLDKMVREHVERGFNCIRLDDGAGLMHDIKGIRRGTVNIASSMFGKYTNVIRQQGDIIGDGGGCNLFERMIQLCSMAKKYGVYIVLSSWYYLHTYWLHPKGDKLADELFGILPHERFMAFAKFLDYILCELEDRDLDGTIAFAEILNEADGLPFINGYGNHNGLTDEEIAVFREEHERALEWLQERHPQILFAFDSYTAWTDIRQVPGNMQVYNFHNYYLWSIYDEVIADNKELICGKVTEADVRGSRLGMRPAADDWYKRVTLYNNLNPSKLEKFEVLLEEKLNEKFDDYLKIVDENLDNVKRVTSDFPDIPIVCGEGVSYIASRKLLWEEKSEKYWQLAEAAMKKYKDFGMWGTVVRTCCGPEDPCWNMCADKLKYLNDAFLK